MNSYAVTIRANPFAVQCAHRIKNYPELLLHKKLRRFLNATDDEVSGNTLLSGATDSEIFDACDDVAENACVCREYCTALTRMTEKCVDVSSGRRSVAYTCCCGDAGHQALFAGWRIVDVAVHGVREHKSSVMAAELRW